MSFTSTFEQTDNTIQAPTPDCTMVLTVPVPPRTKYNPQPDILFHRHISTFPIQAPACYDLDVSYATHFFHYAAGHYRHMLTRDKSRAPSEKEICSLTFKLTAICHDFNMGMLRAKDIEAARDIAEAFRGQIYEAVDAAIINLEKKDYGAIIASPWGDEYKLQAYKDEIFLSNDESMMLDRLEPYEDEESDQELDENSDHEVDEESDQGPDGDYLSVPQHYDQVPCECEQPEEEPPQEETPEDKEKLLEAESMRQKARDRLAQQIRQLSLKRKAASMSDDEDEDDSENPRTAPRPIKSYRKTLGIEKD